MNLVSEKKEKPTIGERKRRSRFFLGQNKKQKGVKGEEKGGAILRDKIKVANLMKLRIDEIGKKEQQLKKE